MLNLKRFDHKDYDQFNKFREEHPPRNSKNQSGIILNEAGLWVFYEEGEPYTKGEAKAQVLEEIRTKKTEIVMGKPALKVKENEVKQWEKMLKEVEAELAELTSAPESKQSRSELKGRIGFLKKNIDDGKQVLLIGESNEMNARAQIQALRDTISDIEDGTIEL